MMLNDPEYNITNSDDLNDDEDIKILMDLNAWIIIIEKHAKLMQDDLNSTSLLIIYKI